jgi:hypothetical protein
MKRLGCLLALVVGLVACGGSNHHPTRRSPPIAASTSVPSTSEPSTTALAPTTSGTAGTQLPQESAPTTGPSSPWHISATSGLTNLAPVTFNATGIPPGNYAVGQCPAGQTPSLTTCAANGRPNFVTVTDGTLSSTVHVFWWLSNGRVDCGSAPGACVVGVANQNPRSGFAPVSFPISFDLARRPKITVTPDNSLSDGQSVVVSGADVGEGTVQIEECLVPQWASCTYLEARSQPDGTFRTTMTVHRQLQWGGHGAGSGTCGVDGDCAVEVWVTPKGLDSYRIWINPDQPVGLRFAPAPPPPSTASPITTTN